MTHEAIQQFAQQFVARASRHGRLLDQQIAQQAIGLENAIRGLLQGFG